MHYASDNDLFSLLPEKRPPWKEFVFSMGTQGLTLVALVWVGVLFPQVIDLPNHDYHFIALVSTPPPVNHTPAPVRVFKSTPPPQVAAVEPPPEALRVPEEIRHAKPQPEDLPAAPKVSLAATKPVALPPAKVVIPRQLVKTDVFSTGSSAVPTMAAAPSKVQTGGFGDPNGVPARENNGKPVNIAALGSPDLPAGPGFGNGTGGAHGARGVIASAGFGNGVATGDGSGRTNASRGNGAGGVREAGFGGAEPTTGQANRPKVQQEAAARTVPAEVLSKPTPVYTAEARKLHIEGEVLLEVVFEATGKIRVVRVVQGLGHGLDEAAVRAAEQISFKPALRDGQPADSAAVLHIVFQLA
jgi:TonB family protein